MITVINKHTYIPTSQEVIFYVGRGSPLGNIYSSINFMKTKAQFKCETREESIKKFSQYINEKIEKKDKIICNELNKIWEAAKQGKDVKLSCFCSPKPCHATIIKNIIEKKL